MKFSAARDVLLKPLQAVIGVVERRQTMPILSNVLLVAKGNNLAVTATDLEVEQVIVRSGRSKFSLATLPAAEFPTVEDIKAGQTVKVDQAVLARLIEKTHFSMAQQDVRYYLNGMLLETGGKQLRAVATDGHRLALSEAEVESAIDEQQVIVPRKGVLELQRLLSGEGSVDVDLGENHVRIQLESIRFTSKLIDGRFPEYERVIPQDSSNELTADREALRSALQRTAILSNEKYRGIRLIIRDSGVVMQAHNPEQEEAEEELEVAYSGEDIEIGFNVNYLLDALGGVDGDEVSISVQDGNSSCLIRKPGTDECKFVVMPMRL
jgi:DNA polymerase-3 subunit beta